MKPQKYLMKILLFEILMCQFKLLHFMNVLLFD